MDKLHCVCSVPFNICHQTNPLIFRTNNVVRCDEFQLLHAAADHVITIYRTQKLSNAITPVNEQSNKIVSKTM